MWKISDLFPILGQKSFFLLWFHLCLISPVCGDSKAILKNLKLQALWILIYDIKSVARSFSIEPFKLDALCFYMLLT